MSNYLGSVSTGQTASKSGFWQSLVSTRPSWTPIVLRFGLTLMLWPHGAQKLLGWFGGYGFRGTMDAMGGSLPAPVVFLVILGEFFAPFLLVGGFLTRFAAASVALIMVGAALLVHLPNGFFMNWAGAQAGEGFEFHLLAITIALALVVSGGGSGSVDLKLTRKD